MNATTTPQAADIVNLSDCAGLARASLDDNAWSYFSGGAADEHTLRANDAAWSQIGLLPRVLRPLAGGHTRVQLLGRTLAHPLLLAPVAYQRMANPDGEIASALAAAALGAGMVLSTQSSMPMEDVARTVHGTPDHGPLWFQLYWQADRGQTLELVQRAERAGFEALVLTVDAPVNGVRDRERRSGFRLPAGIRAVHLEPPGATALLQPGQSALFDGLLRHAPTWDDVTWLRDNTRLPVLLKGILHPDDARQAAALQLDGIIVSNHGGRTLDTTPATAHILPRIADATQGDMALLVDGGIRRGTDVLKAIALGANAVLIGRPYIYALAHAGAHGVARVLRLLHDELEIAMALSGCRTLEDAGRSLLVAPGGSAMQAGHSSS